METTLTLEKKRKTSKDLIKLIESKFLKSENDKVNEIRVGDIIKIEYKIPEGDKERIQSYEGLVISKQNRTLGKSFTLRRTVQGIGIEQIFLLNSPKIASITKKQSSKVRRAKLYFIRSLSGKSTRLKIKR
jgi:large subunit ribosomal protein L19